MKRLFPTIMLSLLFPFCRSVAADTLTVSYTADQQAELQPAAVEGLKITVKNGDVKIKDWRTSPKPLFFILKGKSTDGSFKLNTEAAVTLQLENLELTSQQGAPLHLKNKNIANIIAADGTRNVLTVTTCTDTVKQKAAVIWAKNRLRIAGKGQLNLIAQGDGCKGINCKDSLIIESLTLDVQTLGNNLGVDTTRNFGFGGPPPSFNLDSIPAEMKAQFEEMRKRFEEMGKDGAFPMMGGPGKGMGFGGMKPEGGFGTPPMGGGPGGVPGDGPGGGPGGKQKYLSTCKGIKAKGTLTIQSGKVSVTTNSRGAEGMEGKQGVTINGGEVAIQAVDDAINSGGQIIFNGGRTCAISTNNDAVDSNLGEFGFGGGMPPFMMGDDSSQNRKNEQEPAIVINGGEVLAWSQNGPPEEGLDCDFAPIQVTGGTILSIGAGMGEMPSVPTNETAQQPTALLIGLNIQKGQPVSLYKANAKGKATGKPLFSYTVPFDFQRSASIISHAALKTGQAYLLKSAGKDYPLKLTEPFTICR